MLPTPDFDSDLHTGSQIDLANPPQHCTFPMQVSAEHGGYRVECVEFDYEIHTSEDGVLTEPPHTTA
ncbi:hypothetical protein [Nonomuraea aurantiaca]|uniref:hypothetical protein n=1 Tax=Nonomuraea aurantiaca TaxID=2878562 RepID=UPI001CD94F7B|nr:hypothetical protein [Nonomuraea aurantiaca]MCA2227387.1 hypothetical protein [Nonomuraea aurantiaca]